MTIERDISDVVPRMRVKARIAASLAELSPRDQHLVLIDLLAELKVAAGALEATNGVSPRVSASSSTQERRSRRSQPGARTPIRSPGAAEKPKTERVVDFLARHKTASIAEIAVAVYGDDSRISADRVRSMLTSLKKQGRVARTNKRGRWRVARKG